MLRPLSWCLAGVVALLLAAPLPCRAASPACPLPPELTEVTARLPHLAQRLHNRQPVTIVAIGGASTRGAAAGAPEHAYPHRLQLALRALYPGDAITVLNKGVPRQTAQQMVARFATDVFAEHPVLVVWETGTVDAVRGVEIDDFANALQSGIDLLKNRAIDIVLVDMQFSRRLAAIVDLDRYLATMRRVADLNEIYMFSRFAVMRYWSEQDVLNVDDVAASERTQMAARVYACIGDRLAAALRDAVQ